MFYVVRYHTRTIFDWTQWTTMMEVLRRELAHVNQGSSDAFDLCLLCDSLKMTNRLSFVTEFYNE